MQNFPVLLKANSGRYRHYPSTSRYLVDRCVHHASFVLNYFLWTFQTRKRQYVVWIFHLQIYFYLSYSFLVSCDITIEHNLLNVYLLFLLLLYDAWRICKLMCIEIKAPAPAATTPYVFSLFQLRNWELHFSFWIFIPLKIESVVTVEIKLWCVCKASVWDIKIHVG